MFLSDYEELKAQKELQDQALQDLAQLVSEGEVRPAAPVGIETTTAIGLPPAVQPGFRVNTHVVSITPEEMLSQNLAEGVQVAIPTVAPTPVQPTYQPVPAEKIPETGPEAWVIAFIAASFRTSGTSKSGWPIEKFTGSFNFAASAKTLRIPLASIKSALFAIMFFIA